MMEAMKLPVTNDAGYYEDVYKRQLLYRRQITLSMDDRLKNRLYSFTMRYTSKEYKSIPVLISFVTV